MIKHGPKAVTAKVNSVDRTSSDLPLSNGHIDSKTQDFSEETTLQKLLTLDCQWLVETVK